MKLRLLLAFSLASCSAEPPAPSCGADGAMMQGSRALVLTTALDFSSSSLDLVPLASSCPVESNRVLADGDAALRILDGQAVIINRGNASNLLFLDGEGYPSRQVSLGVCNPHDIELADDGRALVTCYDALAPKVIDLATGAVSDGPSFADFIAGDSDGLPEMDQMVRASGRIYVSVQRLDRTNDYAPLGAGSIVAIDAATLALVDVDPVAAGAQGYDVCVDPYADLARMPDGRVAVACAGDFMDPSTFALVALDVTNGATTVLADGAALGGAPYALRVDAAGAAYVVVSAPLSVDPWVEMRAVRIQGTSTILYSKSGFSLGGVAVDSAGHAYVADRSSTDSAGLWVVSPSGDASGPMRTGQPPYEIELF